MMTDRAWPLLVVAVVLVVFLPAFSAEVCKVDDAQMLVSLHQTTTWKFKDLFLPGASDGLYYRPLLMLSFFVDKEIFNLNPFTLHTENVLLHLANTLLVYFIIRSLFSLNRSASSPGIAFLGSLLFGLHPMATESVNWISGRTDLLMGFFLLLSTWLLVQYRSNGRRLFPWLAAIAFLAALLSKELAVAFLPGYFLILHAKIPGQDDHLSPSVLRWRNLLIFAGVTVLVIGTFFLLRSIAFTTNSSRIGLTLQFMQVNPEYSLFLFLRAIGFYLKKLVMPWPLNFAIVEVDPLYELAAFPLLGLCLYIACKRTLGSALFVTGVLMFSPALLIALNQIAWTPYAERYLYCTVAFVSMATAIYCDRQHSLLGKQWRYGLLSGFVLIGALTTWQRNLTWQTNERILADTARKSPSEGTVQWLYGAALFAKGDYHNALVYTQRAASLPRNPLFYNSIPDINLGIIYYHLDRIPEAIVAYQTVIGKNSGNLPEAHEGLMDCYRRLWSSTIDMDQKREFFKAMQGHGTRLFDLRPDPIIYYNLGKYAMVDRDTATATVMFHKAVSNMKEDHQYLPFARKLLQQL